MQNQFLFLLLGSAIVLRVAPFALVNAGLDITSVQSFPWSLTPIFAAGMFTVARLKDPVRGYSWPLLAWLAGDVAIGVVTGMSYGFEDGLRFAFYPGQIVNYVALALAISCGWALRRTTSIPRLILCGLLAPSLFFLISNWAAWRFDVSHAYPLTPEGLWTAYLAGLPFYRNQLISTAFCLILLFGRSSAAAWQNEATIEPESEAAPVRVR